MLEDISLLERILGDMKIPYDDIIAVDDETDPIRIRTRRDRLKMRYTKNKSFETVQDIVMMTSWGLETVFDGERSYFGFKPDLTDLSPKSAVKLRRIRYESTHAMEGVMTNVPFWQTLLMEFGPMIALHAKQNSDKNKDDRSEDYERQIQANINNIRQYE